MFHLKANVAQFRFTTEALGADVFDVVDFVGDESLSRLPRYTINLVSRDPDVPLEEVVNQSATLTISRGLNSVPIHGIVANVQHGGRTADRFGYTATLVPRLWLLTLTKQSRIFQQQRVDQIIEQVLNEAGLSGNQYRLDLSGTYAVREYCVQYRETDFDFISRLMEHEGIFYFFEHTEQDVLVMADRSDSCPRIPGDDIIQFNEGGGAVPDDEAIREFSARERIVTGQVLLKDYNYTTPETDLQASSQINAGMPGRSYEYGQHFPDQQAGERLARIRNEEIECGRLVMSGEGDCRGLRPGFIFGLSDHYRKSLNGDYLITGVRHFGAQGAALSGQLETDEDQQTTYRNEFTCIPATVPFRPPCITPVPRLPGILTARIETAGGDYAYIDEHGRYRAKMHFDLSSQSGGTATRPIRMSQPYSGPDYGIHFPNHADTEVVVGFIDGNLDRPIALGTVPNPSNASPSKAENKMHNIIRTFSGSELVMDDTIDKAKVHVKTPDANTMVFDDESDRIMIETTNKHTVTLDDKNENIEVKTKDGHFALMDDKNKKITLQSKDGHRISINDQDKLMTIVDAKEENMFQIDIGNKKLTIKSAKGDIDFHAPKGTIDIKATKLNIETSGDTEMKAANIKSEAKSDHKVKASNLTTEATMALNQKGMNVTTEASMNHTIKGLNVTVEAGVKNDVKGAFVNVQASGVNTIQGALVKIN